MASQWLTAWHTQAMLATVRIPWPIIVQVGPGHTLALGCMATRVHMCRDLWGTRGCIMRTPWWIDQGVLRAGYCPVQITEHTTGKQHRSVPAPLRPLQDQIAYSCVSYRYKISVDLVLSEIFWDRGVFMMQMSSVPYFWEHHTNCQSETLGFRAKLSCIEDKSVCFE